jgi:purine-binding chemotaxis protein CheW
MSEPEEPRGWEQLARRAAEGAPAAEESALLRELLVFTLNGDPYAIAVERVREIVRLRPITPVPRVPEAIRGVISLRGEVVQVIDLRRRIGLPPVEPSRSTRIVVLHGEDGRLSGLLVDAVSEVLRVTEDRLRPDGPGDAVTVSGLCVRGDQFVSLVDLDRVLDLGDEH